jgi:hypothetical protein
MIAMHMGSIPETAMVLGPVLLIAAFIRIARRNEANLPDEDDWDADLGDLPERHHDAADRTQNVVRPGEPPAVRRASPRISPWI